MRFISQVLGIHWRVASFLFILALLPIVGCGDGKIARYPVNGIVNVDGKPVAGAMVTFCPVNGSDEMQRLRPSGFSDAEGKFHIMTLQKNDGAPVGQYKILIQWPAIVGGVKGDGGQGMGPDQLRGRYWNLEKSQITVDVKPVVNDLPPFELKSR